MSGLVSFQMHQIKMDMKVSTLYWNLYERKLGVETTLLMMAYLMTFGLRRQYTCSISSSWHSSFRHIVLN